MEHAGRLEHAAGDAGQDLLTSEFLSFFEGLNDRFSARVARAVSIPLEFCAELGTAVQRVPLRQHGHAALEEGFFTVGAAHDSFVALLFEAQRVAGAGRYGGVFRNGVGGFAGVACRIFQRREVGRTAGGVNANSSSAMPASTVTLPDFIKPRPNVAVNGRSRKD